MRNIFLIAEERIVIGKSFPVLAMNGAGMYVFSDIEVYKDGEVRCPGVRSVNSLESLARAVERGDVATIDKEWLEEQKQEYNV